MLSVAEQKKEYGALLARTEALLDAADDQDRGMTPEETREYDAGIAKLTAMKAEIEGAQRPTFRSQPGDTSHLHDEVDGLDEPRLRRMPSFHPGAKLQAFSNDRAGHAAAYRSGQWLRAALLGDAKALNWCSANGVKVNVMAAHSEGDNAKGGVLVPEEYSANLIRLVDQYGVFRRNTRMVPMSSDTLNIPRRTGGLVAAYFGEGAAGTESDTTWDNVQLVTKKLMVLTRMSSEIAEDAVISMADMLAMECALAFALKEDTVGFTGTGIAADGGIVGILVKAIDGTHTKAAITASGAGNSADVFSEITSDHLLDLMAGVPMYAKAGSRWYCSPTALELAFNAIKIAGGGNSFENLANAVEPRFLGYPIELSSVFPDDPAEDLSGKVMIAFGNLAQAATLGARREIRFRMSEERYWAEDQVGVKATMRHDINVHNLGSTTIKSPFCVLVGN